MNGWLTLGGDASLRRALSRGGQQASWQPEGLVKSIAALEVRADGDEHTLRLCALGSLLGPLAPPEGSDGDEVRAWAEQFLARRSNTSPPHSPPHHLAVVQNDRTPSRAGGRGLRCHRPAGE